MKTGTFSDAAILFGGMGMVGAERACMDLIKNGAEDEDRLAMQQFLNAGERGEKNGIFNSTVDLLDDWVSEKAKDMCRETSWTWEELLTGAQPFAVFLVGGMGSKATNEYMVRMFYGIAAASAFRLYGETGLNLPRRFLIMLDEADLLGNCEPVYECVTQTRSMGVRMFLAYQSIEQVENNFGKNGSVLRENMELVYTGGMKRGANAAEVSKLLGMITVKTQSKGQGGVSENEQARALITEDEIYGLPYKKQLILLNNRGAIVDKPWKVGKQGIEWR
jgi:type IV secretory pathway TraG/TraD family ATPase VirD4